MDTSKPQRELRSLKDTMPIVVYRSAGIKQAQTQSRYPSLEDLTEEENTALDSQVIKKRESEALEMAPMSSKKPPPPEPA
jgi:hypothetical protein